MKERGLAPGGFPSDARVTHIPTVKKAPVSAAYDGRQFVGIDLHRRRSVVSRTDQHGNVLEAVRISNDRHMLAEVMGRAGEEPEVVLEATYGWYWAADLLATIGANVHLAHPLGVKAFAYRRVKNDFRDATDLADLLRMVGCRSLDRPTRGPRPAAAGAPSGQAGRGPHRLEVPGSCRPGRLWHPGAHERPVRRGRHRAAGPPPAFGAVPTCPGRCLRCWRTTDFGGPTRTAAESGRSLAWSASRRVRRPPTRTHLSSR